MAMDRDSFIERVQEITGTQEENLGTTLAVLERVFKKISDEKVYEAYLFAYIRGRSGASIVETFGPMRHHVATAIGVSHGRDGVAPDTMQELLAHVESAFAQTQPESST